jgi:hypothetical protein
MRAGARAGLQRPALVVAAAVSVAFAACSGKSTQAGGLEVLVSTSGISAPGDFDSVEIVAQQETSPGTWHQLFDETRSVPGEITLPTTFSIQAGSSSDQDALVTVTAILAGMPVVQRVVQTQVPTDRVAELTMLLARDCVGKVMLCPKGQSCQPTTGTCGANVVAPSTLPPYNPGDENHVDASMAAADAAGEADSRPEAGRDGADGASEVSVDSSADVESGIDAADGAGEAEAGLPPVPVGFTGPIAFWTGPAGPEPASCHGNYPTQLLAGNAGLTCPAATCPCSCGSPQGVICLGPTVWWNNTATCPLGDGTAMGGGACQAVNVSNPDYVSVQFFNVAHGGSCVPKGGSPGKTGPTWATSGIVCGGSCAQGVYCGAPPKNFTTCVYLSGQDVSCPTTGYTSKTVLYSGVDDTRGCGSCTCAGPTGASCNGSIDVYSGTGCTGTHTTAPTATCTHVSSVASFSYTGSFSGGSCAPQVSATGSCTESGPTTVCCLP